MGRAEVQGPKWIGLASDTEGFSAHLNWARDQILKEIMPTEQNNTAYNAGVT